MYDFQQDMKRGIEQDNTARQEAIRRAWRAYDGDHPQPLMVKPGKANHNVILNPSRLAVDAGAVFLFGGEDEEGSEIQFAIDGNDDQKNDEERYLEDVWGDNEKMATLYKLATNGGVAGHTFIKIVVRPDRLPRLIVLDPATVFPDWEPHDIGDVWRWVIQFSAEDKGQLVEYKEVIERDSNGRWTISNHEMRGNAKEFTLVSQVDWPYSWSPIHDCQNIPTPNLFWGTPDLTDDLLDLNHSINRTLSNIDLILGYHAHPKTWGKGITSQQLDVAADGTILINSPDGELANLEMSSDLVSSINHYNSLRQAFFEQAHVPQVALGGVADASRVSSLTLRVMYAPLFQNTLRKKSTYGNMLKKLNAHLLEMGGFEGGRMVRNRWPQVLPDDPMQVAQVALLHNQMGASKRTILARLGYNPLTERGYTREEADNLGGGLLAAFDSGAGM